MEPNKLSVSSNIVHKPLSVNCLTPTKECRRSLRPTLARKRVRDASIYASKKYRSSFYS